jgi:osmotically-inducible protein OsmY
MGVVLLSLSLASPAIAQTNSDNTRVNKADELNAGAQKNDTPDLEITRDIRRGITADKSLSVYARNVKIITQHGNVTLKGPVRSDDERKLIEAKAVAVAGQAHVTNELTIAPAKSN